jgi:hypothetical protein
LTLGTVADGEFLARSGTTIDGRALLDTHTPTASPTFSANAFAELTDVALVLAEGIVITLEAGAILTLRSDDFVPPTVLPGGRLTLTSLTPVTTSDVLAATVIYYTPFVGDFLPLWTSANGWRNYRFGQKSLAVPSTTSQMYDVFGYLSGGELVLESLAWTNDTTRATGLTMVNGLQTKTGDQTRLYLGSFRTTTVSGQTEDSFGGGHQAGGHRYVWNMYNRQLRSIGVKETTDSWSYTTATWRQANGNAGNKVECVLGLSEDQVSVFGHSTVANPDAAVAVSTGVGIDSTTVNSALLVGTFGQSAAGSNSTGQTTVANYRGFPAIGYHALNWIEISQASGTTTWYGDKALAYLQSGLQAEIMA